MCMCVCVCVLNQLKEQYMCKKNYYCGFYYSNRGTCEITGRAQWTWDLYTGRNYLAPARYWEVVFFIFSLLSIMYISISLHLWQYFCVLFQGHGFFTLLWATSTCNDLLLFIVCAWWIAHDQQQIWNKLECMQCQAAWDIPCTVHTLWHVKSKSRCLQT